ncbi:hypothetical protein [Streptomyces sp. NPDC049881]|uniref:hypothetical protein n=1 Tax=Streptomyces sp. NPDC049881 TaxID=3155778 RepID=UPI0034457069
MVLLAACGGEPEEREYALPQDLCGIDVPQELYEPLFPPGTELQVTGRYSEDMQLLVGQNCGYDLDGEDVFETRTAALDRFDSYLSSRDLDYSMDDAEEIAGDFDVVVWPGFAMAKAPCTIGNEDASVIEWFMIALRADHPEDDAESRAVLVRLIEPYMRAMLQQMPCAE